VKRSLATSWQVYLYAWSLFTRWLTLFWNRRKGPTRMDPFFGGTFWWFRVVLDNNLAARFEMGFNGLF
jgi:hypothetical protein